MPQTNEERLAATAHDVEWLSNTHPLPWKVRQRPPGSTLRGKFPWEVVDANGHTVALSEYGQVGAIAARHANACAEPSK